jgi:hypothetical protein
LLEESVIETRTVCSDQTSARSPHRK